MKYEKISLAYGYNDLEPYIDAETVETHYSKHLQTYVDNLNKLLEDYKSYTCGKTMEEILKDVNNIPDSIRQGVINNGGGVVNHNFYFSILTPNGGGKPKGILMNHIEEELGGFEKMKELVSNTAVGKFGSGWSWLVLNEYGDLEVMATSNQDTPISYGKIPLLTIDVWEHAYYLKYKNLRAEYVKNIWNLFNWDIIENIYEKYRVK